MTETKRKLAILSQIAAELNRRDVTWAIGASCLLYLKGIVQEFSDIDIMIAESDVDKVKQVLLALGKQLPSTLNTHYTTKEFLEFTVDDVDVDVMAGFSLIHDSTEFYFPLEKDQIRDYAKINGAVIPLQSIEEWRYYYKLMGRTNKVEMIDQYIQLL